MKTNTAGISDKEIAEQIRTMAKLLNDLLLEASDKGLNVDVSINPHFKNTKTVTIGKITQTL